MKTALIPKIARETEKCRAIFDRLGGLPYRAEGFLRVEAAAVLGVKNVMAQKYLGYLREIGMLRFRTMPNLSRRERHRWFLGPLK